MLCNRSGQPHAVPRPFPNTTTRGVTALARRAGRSPRHRTSPAATHPEWLLLGAVLLAAALQPWPAAAQDSPVFRSRTDLVRLDVTVTGRDGRPVDDLRREEVLITENGQPRPVVLFRRFSRPGATAGSPRETPGVAANGAAPVGQRYILVFDQLHMTPRSEQRARLAAEGFISRSLRPGDEVAIYALPGRGALLGFTSDAARARAALGSVHGQANRPATGLTAMDPSLPARGAGTASVLDAFRDERPGIAAESATEARLFLSQLAGVMQGLQATEGRKALVMFSEGFFLDNLASRIEQVSAAAARSHSIVYPVDLAVGGSTLEQAPSATSSAEVLQRREPLAMLALETSGRLITGSGNLDGALDAVAAENSDYYLVAFEPTAAQRSYHRVQVRTTRPGAVVRSRTGYSAAPVLPAYSEREAVDAALTAPHTSTALPIQYTTYERIGPSADKPRILLGLTAYVPNRARPAGAASERADIVFIVREMATRQVAASGSDRLAVPVGGENRPGELEPVTYSVQFDLAPGEYWMRVAVREPGGIIGTADRRFRVWPLAGAGLSTSDLIVTPLEGDRFDAPASAVVKRDDKVLAYLEIYGGVERATTEIAVLKEGSSEVVATAEPLVKAGTHGETIVRAHLPVEGLADGTYTARVRVAAPNEAPRIVVRSFRVVSEQ